MNLLGTKVPVSSFLPFVKHGGYVPPSAISGNFTRLPQFLKHTSKYTSIYHIHPSISRAGVHFFCISFCGYLKNSYILFLNPFFLYVSLFDVLSMAFHICAYKASVTAANAVLGSFLSPCVKCFFHLSFKYFCPLF